MVKVIATLQPLLSNVFGWKHWYFFFGLITSIYALSKFRVYELPCPVIFSKHPAVHWDPSGAAQQRTRCRFCFSTAPLKSDDPRGSTKQAQRKSMATRTHTNAVKPGNFDDRAGWTVWLQLSVGTESVDVVKLKMERANTWVFF